MLADLLRQVGFFAHSHGVGDSIQKMAQKGRAVEGCLLERRASVNAQSAQKVRAMCKGNDGKWLCKTAQAQRWHVKHISKRVGMKILDKYGACAQDTSVSRYLFNSNYRTILKPFCPTSGHGESSPDQRQIRRLVDLLQPKAAELDAGLFQPRYGSRKTGWPINPGRPIRDSAMA